MNNDNNNRFVQDMDEIIESPLNRPYGTSRITRKRIILEAGTLIRLKDNQYGEITLTRNIVKYADKWYDYEGEYINEYGGKSKIYFNESEISEIKKNEGVVK